MGRERLVFRAQNAVEHELFDAIEGGARARPRSRQRHLEIEVDDAVAQHDHAIGEHDGFVDVVRDQERREPLLLPEPLDQPLHADARERVQRPEWFVEEQEIRLRKQGAREGDALLFAAREGSRKVLGVVAESHVLEQRKGVGRSLLAEPEQDVVERALPGQEAVILKNHADARVHPR